VRDRDDVEAEFAGSVVDRDEVPAGYSAAIDTPDTADDVHIQGGEQCGRSFQAAGRVMIASGDDDLHSRPRGPQAAECSVKQLLGFAGWILAVEDVADYEYDVHLALCDNPHELVEDGEVLRFPAVSPKGVADMPIRGMENAYQLEISDDCFKNTEYH